MCFFFFLLMLIEKKNTLKKNNVSFIIHFCLLKYHFALIDTQINTHTFLHTYIFHTTNASTRMSVFVQIITPVISHFLAALFFISYPVFSCKCSILSNCTYVVPSINFQILFFFFFLYRHLKL